MANDLISRQAALDAVFQYADNAEDKNIYKAILALPSAEPYTVEEIQKMQDMEQAQLEKAFELGKEDAKAEIVRCKDCKHWNELLNICDRTKRLALGVNGFCSMAERRTDDLQ